MSFQKNTNMPDMDSYLWSLGNGWKISQGKGNKIYCPLDKIIDQQLGEEMENQLNSETKKPFNYSGFFFVPSAMDRDGKTSFLVYAFSNEDEAERHASFKPTPQQGQQSTFRPRQQQQIPQYKQQQQTPKPIQSNTITTFIDEILIEWDDFAKKQELEADGFVRLPASLISPNILTNKEGNLCVWMGKVINAKIANGQV